MQLGPAVHDFGIMSPRWLITGYKRGGPNDITLVLSPSFPEASPEAALRRAKQSFFINVFPHGTRPPPAEVVPEGGGQPSIGIVRGVVQDETGAVLGGIRLLAINERRQALVAVTQSDARGRFTLVTIAGPTRFVVHAPGLLLRGVRRTHAAGEMTFVMKIDPDPEELRLRSGRLLSFKLADSLYPEFLPPAKARAVIHSDYGIDLGNCFCPGDLLHLPSPTPEQYRDACKWQPESSCLSPSRCPLTTWARQCQLPRYWWLRLLQQSPPNPNNRESAELTKTMWWYESIKAMQAADAQADRQQTGR